MSTVLIDNSLCVYTLKDSVSGGLIYDYIEALRDAGVRYVELDFRAIMKMDARLPEGIGYIFRLMDPMFVGLAKELKFDYLLITTTDLEKGIQSDIPIMLECQTDDGVAAGRITRVAMQMVDGEITAVRLRKSFPMLSVQGSRDWRIAARNAIMLPMDICPMNEGRTALDTALKFTKENVDSLTLTMGSPERYCSMEEYIITLMTVFDALPPNYDLNALCKASVYQNAIFRNGNAVGISRLLNIIDRDSQLLVNADTGKKVNLKAIVRKRHNMRTQYVTALESLARRDNWQPEDYKMITDTLKRFGDSFYSSDLLNCDKHTGFLN
ncbi:MAG: hypothetical protein HDT42_11055 [Ruminococcaceae bacterium]|nr:hypothetical protein [Oscillospiraceae bacterium]